MPKRKTRNKKSLFQPSHLKDDRKKRESASKEYTMQHRIPTVGSTPVDYHIPPILLHLFRHIETMADATLSALRNVDQFNERYFDQTIDSICLLADTDLKEQERSHKRVILSIEQELQASILEHKNYLTILEEIYGKNEQEIKNYEKLNEEQL